MRDACRLDCIEVLRTGANIDGGGWEQGVKCGTAFLFRLVNDCVTRTSLVARDSARPCAFYSLRVYSVVGYSCCNMDLLTLHFLILRPENVLLPPGVHFLKPRSLWTEVQDITVGILRLLLDLPFANELDNLKVSLRHPEISLFHKFLSNVQAGQTPT